MKKLIGSALIIMIGCQLPKEESLDSEKDDISGVTAVNDITASDLKKHYLSVERIKKGLVKKFQMIYQRDTSIFYELKKEVSENEFLSQKLSSDFKLISEGKYVIHQDGSYDLKSLIGISEKGDTIPFKIIETWKTTFDPQSQTQYPISEFYAAPGVLMTDKTKETMVGKEKGIFLGKEISCIRYEQKTIRIINDSIKDLSFNDFFSGYVLIGEGIGKYFDVSIGHGDTTVSELIEIMEIDEFNELRSQHKID